MARHTRPRLSSIELLPEECDSVVAWAAEQLQGRDRTQTEIYQEFVAQLEGIQREHRGELDFTIPSIKSFNRYSVKLATLTSRLNQTREIASTLAEKFDAADSDNLTLIAAEAIKTLVFELITNSGEGGMQPKEAKALADALRAASQAQGVSTARRQKVEKEFQEQAEKAVETVAKAKGLSRDTVADIKAQILGVGK